LLKCFRRRREGNHLEDHPGASRASLDTSELQLFAASYTDRAKLTLTRIQNSIVAIPEKKFKVVSFTTWRCSIYPYIP